MRIVVTLLILAAAGIVGYSQWIDPLRGEMDSLRHELSLEQKRSESIKAAYEDELERAQARFDRQMAQIEDALPAPESKRQAPTDSESQEFAASVQEARDADLEEAKDHASDIEDEELKDATDEYLRAIEQCRERLARNDQLENVSIADLHVCKEAVDKGQSLETLKEQKQAYLSALNERHKELNCGTERELDRDSSTCAEIADEKAQLSDDIQKVKDAEDDTDSLKEAIEAALQIAQAYYCASGQVGPCIFFTVALTFFGEEDGGGDPGPEPGPCPSGDPTCCQQAGNCNPVQAGACNASPGSPACCNENPGHPACCPPGEDCEQLSGEYRVVRSHTPWQFEIFDSTNALRFSWARDAFAVSELSCGPELAGSYDCISGSGDGMRNPCEQDPSGSRCLIENYLTDEDEGCGLLAISLGDNAETTLYCVTKSTCEDSPPSYYAVSFSAESELTDFNQVAGSYISERVDGNQSQLKERRELACKR